MVSCINLDHNATTVIDPRVVEVMVRAERDGFGNPASQHQLGRRARRLVEEAREGIAAILGADVASLQANRLIFTSGGTEANNLAIFGLVHAALGERYTAESPQLVVSAIEHPSVLLAADALARRGLPVTKLRVTGDGEVDLEHLAEALAQPTVLVSVQEVNHETGVLQPTHRVAEQCAKAGVLLHTDAVQAVGRIPVHFRHAGAAAMSFTAHKFHGPAGIGALLVRSDVKLEPTLFGGFQQGGLRPGTEPVALAVGFFEALKLWQAEDEERRGRLFALRSRLEQALLAEFPDAVIAGAIAPRLPHTVNIAFPGVDRQALVMALDLAGVACSTGSACASGSSEPSPVLTAMGLPAEVIGGAIRLSLGAFTTAEEIDEAARRIIKAVKHLRRVEKGPKTAATAG